MEKRLAASAAGLRELALLREKHQREVEQLLTSIAHQPTDTTTSDNDEPAPPLPPRWQAPAPTRLCHSVSDDSPTDDPLTHSSCPPHQDYLDRSSTFRRPRRLSESTVYTYPSPMHAILMQYTHSDTACVNEQGFLETTFPAGGEEPLCGHCHNREKSCGAHGSCNASADSKHNASAGPAGLPPSGLRRKSSPLVGEHAAKQTTEQRTEQTNRIASLKGRKSRNSRNLSSLSEEGYFSGCSELSFNTQTQSLSSLFSNDSCCLEDMASESADNQDCEKYFIVSSDGKPNVLCFKDEVEHEDQVFV